MMFFPSMALKLRPLGKSTGVGCGVARVVWSRMMEESRGGLVYLLGKLVLGVFLVLSRNLGGRQAGYGHPCISAPFLRSVSRF